MKSISLLVLGFIPLLSFAQTADPVIVKAKYKVTYSRDDKKLVDDICELDITKSGSYFYSQGLIAQIELINAKTLHAKQANEVVRFTASDLRRDLFPFTTIKNYRQRIAIEIQRIGIEYLAHVRDTLNSKPWNILREEKKIGTLRAQEAIQDRKGNRITAWFCKDLPFQDGPMYYNGLPGLIVSATSSLGWQFDLIDIKFTSEELNKYAISPYRLVSVAQFEKAKKNYAAQLQSGQYSNGDKLEKVKF